MNTRKEVLPNLSLRNVCVFKAPNFLLWLEKKSYRCEMQFLEIINFIAIIYLFLVLLTSILSTLSIALVFIPYFITFLPIKVGINFNLTRYR